MTACCPTCHQTLPIDHPAPSPGTIEAWVAYCREHGHHLLPDGRVSEAVAAELIGIATGTLENKRRAGMGPPAVRLGIRGSRWSYHLADLAAWLELHRYNTDDY